MDVPVLLVDDDLRTLKDIGGLLHEAGFQVTTAVHPREALRLAQEDAFVAVITSTDLPTMSGLELMWSLRSAHPEIPVILLTAVPTTDGHATAIRFGASAYLRKPISALIFLDALTRAIVETSRRV